MANVLVTSKNVTFKGFVVVPTLATASKIPGTIDTLIYNRSSESEEEKIKWLSELKDIISSFIYICDQDKVDNTILIFVKSMGKNGHYIDDEFYLQSAESLNTLISDMDTVTDIIEYGGGGLTILQDFFNRYLRDGSNSKTFTKGYLSQVKSAVTALTEDYKKKDLQLVQMSETATEVFSNTTKLINDLQSSSEKLNNKLAEVSEKVNASKAGLGQPSRSYFFPEICLTNKKSLLRFKDVGQCIYLTSFVIYLRQYFEDIINLRPKLIIIEPVGTLLEKKYSKFTWITEANKRNGANYFNKSVVFTNTPSADVIEKLMSDTDFDTYIILDRLLTSSSHLIKPVYKTSREIYCVSGNSVLKTLHLAPNRCIGFGVKILNSMYSLVRFENYPTEENIRVNIYDQNCSSIYTELNTYMQQGK